MKKVIFHYLRPYYARMALGFVIKFFGTINYSEYVCEGIFR